MMAAANLLSRRFGELADLGTRAETSYQLWAEFSTGAMELIGRIFGRESPYVLQIEEAQKSILNYGLDTSAVSKALGAFKAASDDFNGGYLRRARTLVRADVSEDVLGQAEELLNAGYKDPACVLVGVTLEVALRDLAEQNDLQPGKLEKMNAELAAAQVYNKGMQKLITAWAHWRNSAAHGKWDDYTAEDVKDMVGGVRRFVAEYL